MLLFLLISLIVFVIGYTITYEVIKREIDFEQQRFLKDRLSSVERMISKRGLNRRFERDNILIVPLDSGFIPKDSSIVYSDTLVMHQSLQRIEPHIKLEVNKRVGDRFYYISLYDLIIEEDDIEDGVQESLIKLYILLIIVVFIISAIASYFLLKPFNRTLEKIKLLNIKDPHPVSFDSTNTKEFKKLNSFLIDMTSKMKKDYRALKEFSENASHEMQTPIAIATGKLELLLSNGHLSDEQTALVNSAQESIRRLSKLGNALSLLSKIDNQEFQHKESVNFSLLLKQLFFDFNELIELKELALKSDIKDDVYVQMNSTLAAIMCTNLFQNAIRHNNPGGVIIVILAQDALIIKNSGNKGTIQPDQLFGRFTKDNQNKDSLGLGLAIVKKICDINGFYISYSFVEKMHVFQVNF